MRQPPVDGTALAHIDGMANGALDTTNALLWTLVVIGLLEAVALAIVVIVAVRVHRQTLGTLRELERQIRPLSEHATNLAVVAESIAADVKQASARAAAGAEKAGALLQTTAGVLAVVGGSTHRSFAPRLRAAVGIARGLGVAYRCFVRDRGPTDRSGAEVRRPRGDAEDAGSTATSSGAFTR